MSTGYAPYHEVLYVRDRVSRLVVDYSSLVKLQGQGDALIETRIEGIVFIKR